MTDSSSLGRFPAYFRLFCYSLIALPYLSYVTFPGIVYVAGRLYQRYSAVAADRITRLGFGAIAVLMGMSTAFAYDREQAFLQLFNFLPFFALFMVLPFLAWTVAQLEQIALGLVIASIPLNGLAIVQFSMKLALRNRWLSRDLRQSPLGEWARSLPHQNRASSIFDHPNVFASYLVLILGLGLGVSLYRRMLPSPEGAGAGSAPPQWLYRLLPLALALTLVGLYTAGSRNGIGVAVVQCLIFAGVVIRQRGDRRLAYASLVGLSALLVSVVFIGLAAGRAVSVEGLAHDPRVEVWTIAFDLFKQRPWLGWGLGSYSQLYPNLTTSTQYDYISHTHNLWLLLTTETGILVTLGLTLVIGRVYAHSVLALIRSPFSAQSALVLGYVLAFGGAIAFTLFDVTFYDARVNVINWSVLSGLLAQTPLFQPPPSEIKPLKANHG